MVAYRQMVLLACAAVSMPACVEKAEPVTAVNRQAVSRWVSETATQPQHPLKIKFGDQVELIGYDLSPKNAKPSAPFTVTWHWHARKSVASGFRLFTHVADEKGADRLNQDGVGPLRKAYPPGAWKAGEFIRDPQRIQLPTDWNSPSATLYVGLWKGNERLPVTAGEQDGTHRARALTVPLGKQAEAAEELPRLLALRTAAPPQLDGKLDEPMWTAAQPTPRFVNTLTGGVAEPVATARAAWDKDSLYIAFEVADDFLKSEFDKHDDHLWQQDCVEVILDPDGDGQNYFELQVSPQGTVFDTRYDTRRKPGPFGHTDWNTGLKAGVSRQGKANDDAPDKGYSVEMAIPWQAFAASAKPAAPPSSGDSWRVNFYVLDAQKKGQRGVGWSAPKVGDFHVPTRFGKLLFQAAASDSAPDKAANTQPQSDTKESESPAPASARPRVLNRLQVIEESKKVLRPKPK